jgi:hypothetical protein
VEFPRRPALPEEPSADAIPLNAWGPSGSVSVASEAWAYAASLELARQIAERAGPEHLRAVWSAAARGLGAYQPDANAAELAPSPPDWRGLLDLLEDATNEDFVDLWRTWVARPRDLQLLTNRAIARGYYMRSVALAGDWHLPPETRGAMRAWQFDMAGDLLAAADARDGPASSDRGDGCHRWSRATRSAEAAFEGSAGSAAAAEAKVEQVTLDAIRQRPGSAAHRAGRRRALDHRHRASSPTTRKSACRRRSPRSRRGDLQVAYDEARDADSAWSTAPQVGRSRIVSTALLLIALILLVGIVRERRRRGGGGPGADGHLSRRSLEGDIKAGRAPRTARRRVAGLILAATLAALVGASPPAAHVAVAAATLRLTADATYTLDPEAGRVHVAIQATATSLKPNSSRLHLLLPRDLLPDPARSELDSGRGFERTDLDHHEEARHVHRRDGPASIEPVLPRHDEVHDPLRPCRRRPEV